MRKKRAPKVYVAGFWQNLWEQWRGQETRTISFGPWISSPNERGVRLPILVLRYPKSAAGRRAADELEHAYRQLPMILDPNPLDVYEEVLRLLPATVVTLLREVDPGGCLGHARLTGTESAFSKALAAETGKSVGEVDLAWKLIAAWQPQPLATLAAATDTQEDRDLRFGIALLTVLLHELEHLAFPDREEGAVRGRSDRFYQQVLASSLAEKGRVYGMEVSPSALP